MTSSGEKELLDNLEKTKRAFARNRRVTFQIDSEISVKMFAQEEELKIGK